MIINSPNTNTGQQLARLGNEQQQKQESSVKQLIERAKDVDQDAITKGAGETPLANREQPKVVKPTNRSVPITPQMETKTTLDSITRRYEANFKAMQEKGSNVDTRA